MSIERGRGFLGCFSNSSFEHFTVQAFAECRYGNSATANRNENKSSRIFAEFQSCWFRSRFHSACLCHGHDSCCRGIAPYLSPQIFEPIANVRAQIAIIGESEVGAQSTVDRVDQSACVLVAIFDHALSPRVLTAAFVLGSKSGALKRVLRELFEGKLIAMTIPERRTRSLLRYRITQRGAQRLAERPQSK